MSLVNPAKMLVSLIPIFDAMDDPRSLTCDTYKHSNTSDRGSMLARHAVKGFCFYLYFSPSRGVVGRAIMRATGGLHDRCECACFSCCTVANIQFSCGHCVRYSPMRQRDELPSLHNVCFCVDTALQVATQCRLPLQMVEISDHSSGYFVVTVNGDDVG